MEAPAVQWGPALGILALGLALGAVVLWRLAASGKSMGALPALPPVEVRDLLSRRDILFEQLRELAESSKRTPAQKAVERPPLELEAARVLMALDEAATVAAPVAPAAVGGARRGFLAERSGVRGFLWGVGSMAAVAALGYLVTDAVRPRAAGEGVTGSIPGPAGRRGAESASASPDEAALQARVAANPDDVEARLDLAGLHLAAHDLMAVWNDTQAVLSRHPDEPRALSYQALVRVEMGQPEIALQMLEKAVKLAPDMAPIHVHLMIVYARMGRLADAESTLEKALIRFPADADALRSVMVEIRRAAKEPGGVGAAPPAGDLPPDHPAPVVASAPDAELAGVIELDPAVAAAVPSGATVFVTVRAAGVTQGPPVAAKRLTSAAFPLRFSVSAADSMMGQALPAKLRVEARVDRDGNPLTRDPGDPVARMDDVSAGTRDLRLVLRRE